MLTDLKNGMLRGFIFADVASRDVRRSPYPTR
jgi:hypothetical protein